MNRLNGMRKAGFAALGLTLVFIWVQSMLPEKVSGAESGAVLGWIGPLLARLFGAGSATDHVVRKLAHFTEYTALGFLMLNGSERLMRALRSGLGMRELSPAWSRAADAALGADLCFAAAFLDETIQIFSGRGPGIADVWLDFAGSVFGLLLASLLYGKRIQK